MNIYLSLVVIIFGPLLLASFIRYLSARVRRNFHKSPSPSTEAYREAGCVGSSGEDRGRSLEELI